MKTKWRHPLTRPFLTPCGVQGNKWFSIEEWQQSWNIPHTLWVSVCLCWLKNDVSAIARYIIYQCAVYYCFDMGKTRQVNWPHTLGLAKQTTSGVDFELLVSSYTLGVSQKLHPFCHTHATHWHFHIHIHSTCHLLITDVYKDKLNLLQCDWFGTSISLCRIKFFRRKL